MKQGTKLIFVLAALSLLLPSCEKKKDEALSKTQVVIKEDLSKSFKNEIISLLPKDTSILIYQNFDSVNSASISKLFRFQEFKQFFQGDDSNQVIKDILIAADLIKDSTTPEELNSLISAQSVMFLSGPSLNVNDFSSEKLRSKDGQGKSILEGQSYGLISKSKFSGLNLKTDKIQAALQKNKLKTKLTTNPE